MEIIEVDEVEKMMLLCKRMRKMIDAVLDGVQFLDGRVADIERTLRVVEFRQRHAGGDENED